MLLVGLLLLAGCSTNGETSADEVPVEQGDGVDPDQLADNPCGEGNWDEPPPEVTSLND